MIGNLTMPLTTGDKTITVPITDLKIRVAIMDWAGLSHALHLLETQKLGKDLAGMEVAKLTLRQERDRLHAYIIQRSAPLLTRAGVDLGAWMAHRYTDDFSGIVCAPIEDALKEVEGGE